MVVDSSPEFTLRNEGLSVTIKIGLFIFRENHLEL